jgi:hypothetical protein
MYQVRKWERFQFMIDYEHQQASVHHSGNLIATENLNLFIRVTAKKDFAKGSSGNSKTINCQKHRKQFVLQGIYSK